MRFEVLASGRVVAEVTGTDAVYAVLRLLSVGYTHWRQFGLRYRKVGSDTLIVPALSL